MNWLDILIKIIQIIGAIIQVWRLNGAQEAKLVAEKHRQAICDEACQLKEKKK